MPPDTATAPAHRTLPHNLEAERSVLGAILIDNDSMNVAAAMIDSKAFFRAPRPHFRKSGPVGAIRDDL